ncbi:MAG: hypothetical protein H7Y59_00840 [Anaerolineales bacterium]|nr:hypothetical protein [Anaerolineales bacterium]
MSKLTRSLISIAVFILLLLSCLGGSAATNPASESESATEVSESEENEPATEAPVPQETATEAPRYDFSLMFFPPANITTDGAYNITTTFAESPEISVLNGQVEIFLSYAEPVTIYIFLPEGIQPGTYDIVNLIEQEEGITARFEYLGDAAPDTFESLYGDIDLGATGDSWQGLFHFYAVDPDDQSRFVAVAGVLTK